MAKSLYASANGLARKVKKMYLGIEGVARKVKKGYVGVNGLARLFFSGGLSYEGTAPDLEYPRFNGAAAATTQFALFGGGNIENSGYYNQTNSVEAYTEEFTKSSAPALYQKVCFLAAGSVGGRALFAGGYNGVATFPYAMGFCYDDALSTTDFSLSAAKSSQVAASLFDYVLFVGGQNEYTIGTNTVDAFDASLTRSNPQSMDSSKSVFDGASTGERAVIGPDQHGIGVDAYDNNLTKETAPNFPGFRQLYAAAPLNNMVCFAGGNDNSSGSTQLIVYDDDLAVNPNGQLLYPAMRLTGSGKENIALFAGGMIEGLSNDHLVSQATMVFDGDLICSLGPEISEARMTMMKTVFGSSLIFAGGNRNASSQYCGAVDIFSL